MTATTRMRFSPVVSCPNLPASNDQISSPIWPDDFRRHPASKATVEHVHRHERAPCDRPFVVPTRPIRWVRRPIVIGNGTRSVPARRHDDVAHLGAAAGGPRYTQL